MTLNQVFHNATISAEEVDDILDAFIADARVGLHASYAYLGLRLRDGVPDIDDFIANQKTVTICGSTREELLFREWAEKLFRAGYQVLSLDVFNSWKAEGKNWPDHATKLKLGLAYFRKIENSDAICVLNANGYIGRSTKREIQFAKTLGKAVYSIEPMDGAIDANILLQKGE